jgi:hypothetical protein
MAGVSSWAGGLVTAGSGVEVGLGVEGVGVSVTSAGVLERGAGVWDGVTGALGCSSGSAGRNRLCGGVAGAGVSLGVGVGLGTISICCRLFRKSSRSRFSWSGSAAGANEVARIQRSSSGTHRAE